MARLHDAPSSTSAHASGSLADGRHLVSPFRRTGHWSAALACHRRGWRRCGCNQPVLSRWPRPWRKDLVVRCLQTAASAVRELATSPSSSARVLREPPSSHIRRARQRCATSRAAAGSLPAVPGTSHAAALRPTSDRAPLERLLAFNVRSKIGNCFSPRGGRGGRPREGGVAGRRGQQDEVVAGMGRHAAALPATLACSRDGIDFRPRRAWRARPRHGDGQLDPICG